MQKFTHFGLLAQVLKDQCSHQHSSVYPSWTTMLCILHCITLCWLEYAWHDDHFIISLKIRQFLTTCSVYKHIFFAYLWNHMLTHLSFFNWKAIWLDRTREIECYALRKMVCPQQDWILSPICSTTRV